MTGNDARLTCSFEIKLHTSHHIQNTIIVHSTFYTIFVSPVMNKNERIRAPIPSVFHAKAKISCSLLAFAISEKIPCRILFTVCLCQRFFGLDFQWKRHPKNFVVQSWRKQHKHLCLRQIPFEVHGVNRYGTDRKGNFIMISLLLHSRSITLGVLKDSCE